MSNVTLAVGGMTCASCAARIEKRLNKIDGVHATVNFATEQASIDFGDDVTRDELVAAVEATGYSATLPAAAAPAEPSWLPRLLVSAALSVPVLVLSMVTALHFAGWQWLAFALTTPVVLWGAWPFHRAAVANLRHGAATMDTLISVGVLAAYAWSTWAVLGRPVRATSTSRSRPSSPPSSWPAASSRRAPRRSPAPRSARCWTWAPRTSRCCATDPKPEFR